MRAAALSFTRRESMKTCPFCGTISVNRKTTIDKQKYEKIIVLSNLQLLRRDIYQNIAIYVAALPIPSREVPNWIAEKIFWFEGQILWSDGRNYDVGEEDIDRAFNDDQSFRWVRSFRNRCHIPLKQSPQKRLVSRLRLISLAIQIDMRNNGLNC